MPNKIRVVVELLEPDGMSGALAIGVNTDAFRPDSVPPHVGMAWVGLCLALNEFAHSRGLQDFDCLKQMRHMLPPGMTSSPWRDPSLELPPVGRPVQCWWFGDDTEGTQDVAVLDDQGRWVDEDLLEEHTMFPPVAWRFLPPPPPVEMLGKPAKPNG